MTFIEQLRHPIEFNSLPQNTVSSDCVFSIIIPTWNNLEFIKTCVDSIRKNSRYTHQIILHINEGNDGTQTWAESEKIDYIRSEQNIGICLAINLARSLVKTPYLVYFNDDMYACPDWDYYLMLEIEKQSSIFYMLSSTLIEPRFTGNNCVIAPNQYGEHPKEFREEALLKDLPNLSKKDWQGTTWPPCLVPIALWDMVGGYSIEFSPGMYSDPDFAMKLWQVGVRTFKGVGASLVYHFMSKSTKKLPIKNKGRSLFLSKWGISSNMFTSYYLQRGTDWNGPLRAPKASIAMTLKRISTYLKKPFY
jgi:glycosyltransferase involved in cell wall biosynthesis